LQYRATLDWHTQVRVWNESLEALADQDDTEYEDSTTPFEDLCVAAFLVRYNGFLFFFLSLCLSTYLLMKLLLIADSYTLCALHRETDTEHDEKTRVIIVVQRHDS
jgi:hypothetical protein